MQKGSHETINREFALIYFQLCESETKITDTRMAAKAKGLLRLMRNKTVMGYAHFLHDVLNALSPLMLELQRADSSIYSCHSHLEAATLTLKKLKDR